MKHILIIIFVLCLTACGGGGGKSDITTPVNNSIDGTYIFVDSSKRNEIYILKNGRITMVGRKPMKDMEAAFIVKGKRIEFTFDNQGYLTINDDGSLLSRFNHIYIKQ